MRPEHETNRPAAQGAGETVVGTFPDEASARRAVERLTSGGIAADRIVVGARADQLVATQSEERETVGEMVAGPSIVATKGQTKWFSVGTVVGGAIGTVLGVVLAFIPIGGFSFISRLIAAAAVGMTAGSTIGFLIGGGFGPQLSGETQAPAAQRGVTVRVRSTDPLEIDRARVLLEAAEPERVDEVGPKGEPRLGDVPQGRTEDDRLRDG